MLLSSLCFARDIEECNGFKKEMSDLPSKVNEIVSVGEYGLYGVNNFTNSESEQLILLRKLTNDLEEINEDISMLVDHIMYYHANELNNVELNFIRKAKKVTIDYKENIEVIKGNFNN